MSRTMWCDHRALTSRVWGVSGWQNRPLTPQDFLGGTPPPWGGGHPVPVSFWEGFGITWLSTLVKTVMDVDKNIGSDVG